MVQTPKEKVLEKILSKLKENVVHSEEFLNSESLDPVNKKIENLVQSVHGLMEKDATEHDLKVNLSSVLNGLENMRDACTYYMNAANRAAKDYSTYVYVLEALYNEYSNGACEPIRIAKETPDERKHVAEAVTSPQQQQQQQPQPQPKPKEVVAVAKPKEEKQQEKSGRFKFSFP